MPNSKAQMSTEAQNTNVKRTYNPEERTAQFGEVIIAFVRALPQGPINNPLISQLVRAGTSVGADYMEADGAESKRDFRHKISICKKESKETRHWLRMIASADPDGGDKYRALLNEAHELTLTFSSILVPKK